MRSVPSSRRFLGRVGAAIAIVCGAGFAVGQLQHTSATSTCADAPPAPSVTVPAGPLPTDRSYVASVAVGAFPVDLGVDVRTGRVWVPVSGADRVSGFDQYANTAQTGPRMDVDTGNGSDPAALAVDPTSGQVWVALAGSCQVVAIDGRATTPSITDRVDLAHSPRGIAVDPGTGRVFVSFASVGTVGTIEKLAGTWVELPSRDVAVGVGPVHLKFDANHSRLFVSNEGPIGATTATGQESLAIVSTASDPLKTVANLPLSVPTSVVVDDANGYAYVTENGDDLVTVLKLDARGAPTVVGRQGSDASPNAGNNRNPVGLAILPGSGYIVVSQYGTGGASDDTQHLELFHPNGTGLTLVRAIKGVDKAVGIALDPTTGRVWVSEREAGRVSGFQLDSATSTRLPPPLPESLPGPFDISWAPADVARSAGFAVLIMILLGAPTPLFNHALEANLGEIRRALGIDRLKGSLASGRLGAILRPVRTLIGGWVGFTTYLLAAAVLLSFAERGFPESDGLAILLATVLSIGLVTVVRLIPDRDFMARRFGDRGHIRIVAWVLVIAIGCILVSKISGATPAYVYGIIGAYEFSAILSLSDRGRLAARAGLVLLGLAILVWFIRVPFEPSIRNPAQGAGVVLNDTLVKIFVASVEGIVIGFIPLRFLPGRDLFAWRPWVWALVWGAGMLLFVHVILYAPSDFVPNPDVTPLITIVASVAGYGLIALAFWAFFARRQARSEGRDDEPASA